MNTYTKEKMRKEMKQTGLTPNGFTCQDCTHKIKDSHLWICGVNGKKIKLNTHACKVFHKHEMKQTTLTGEK